MLTKLREFCQEDNDAYFLEVVRDKALTNQNYTGLQVIGSNLDLLGSVPLFSGLLIYSAYVSRTEEELVLYCAENDRMVYVDISSGAHRVLELRDNLAHVVFSQMYQWTDESLVVYGYDGQFYELCVFDGRIAKLDRAWVAERHPLFYGFCQEAQRSGRREVYSNEYQFVTFDEDRGLVCLHDFLHKRVYRTPIVGPFPHEVVFREGTFVLVDETQITVCDQAGVVATLPAPSPYRFLHARFLGPPCTRRLVILSSNLSTPRRSSLALYELDGEGVSPAV